MPVQDFTANDLEALLAPISDASPGGAPLRYERVYDLIREARREDDPSLPVGEWGHKLKVADFGQVARLCADALATRSKDLRVAAWLADAWARTGGIDGAARGLDLFAALVDRYWDTAYPLLDDDEGAEARVSLIEWMDDLLAAAVRRAAIGDANGQVLTYEDWERAQKGILIVHESEGEEAPPVTPEALMARYSLIGAPRWRAVRVSADRALAAAATVHEKVAAKMPRAPVLRRLRDVLSDLVRLSQEITGEDPMPAPLPAAEPQAAEPVLFSPSPDGAAPIAGPIKNRAEAYRRLTEAADFLLRTEPHSPVPYLVKRAVGWGNMSLAELLMELVGTPDDLVTIQRLLGMRGRE